MTEPDEQYRRARELLDTPWRTDSGAALAGARRLIELGPQYVTEAVERLKRDVLNNYHIGFRLRVEAARLLAGLGGPHLTAAAYALRMLIIEYRGEVFAEDNMDAARELARLGPEFVAEAAWELRRQARASGAEESEHAYAARFLADLRGPGVLPAPPQQRDFPAYGLFPGRAEACWVESWGTVGGWTDQPLWHLGLGHQPWTGGTIVVSTWRGLGAERYAENGPVEAAYDAAVDSQAGALGLAFPPDASGKRAEQELLKAVPPLSPRLSSGPTVEVVVDNSRVDFQLRRIGAAWAAVAELGPLAIGAYGCGTELSEHRLVTVPERLGRYAQ